MFRNLSYEAPLFHLPGIVDQNNNEPNSVINLLTETEELLHSAEQCSICLSEIVPPSSDFNDCDFDDCDDSSDNQDHNANNILYLLATIATDTSANTPVSLKVCGHKFHLGCLWQGMQHGCAHQCPVCKKALLPLPSGCTTFPTKNDAATDQFIKMLRGNMPSGTMECQFLPSSCAGYENDTKTRGSIKIIYRIGSNLQKPYHPNPGVDHSGTTRNAYLPNNIEGRDLLCRLGVAFICGLTFTVGTSLTTNRENSVTWASIHHKTSLAGGASKHGYPDANFMSNCHGELDALSIPSSDVCSDYLRRKYSTVWVSFPTRNESSKSIAGNNSTTSMSSAVGSPSSLPTQGNDSSTPSTDTVRRRSLGLNMKRSPKMRGAIMHLFGKSSSSGGGVTKGISIRAAPSPTESLLKKKSRRRATAITLLPLHLPANKQGSDSSISVGVDTAKKSSKEAAVVSASVRKGSGSVPLINTATTTIRVEVPPSVKPGEEFQFLVGANIFFARCPNNVRPGESIPISVPVEKPVGIFFYEAGLRHSKGCGQLEGQNICTKGEALSGLERSKQSILSLMNEIQTQAFRDFLETNGLLLPTVDSNIAQVKDSSLFRSFVEEVQLSLEMGHEFGICIAFHGTDESNITAILREGLDPSKRRGQKHGTGEYFSPRPTLPMRFCKGGRKVLIFLLIYEPSNIRTNDIVVVDNTHRQLPIGTISFVNTTSNARAAADSFYKHVSELVQEKNKKEAMAREARSKEKIIRLLSSGEYLAASDVYKNSCKNGSPSQAWADEVSLFVYDHVRDKERISIYFPGLPHRPKEASAHISSLDEAVQTREKYEKIAQKGHSTVFPQTVRTAAKLKMEGKITATVHIAAAQGDLEALKALEKENYDSLFKVDENGWTALHEAVRGGHIKVVQYLLSKGLDINFRTHNGAGGSPLWWAKICHGKDHAMVKFLEGQRAEEITPDK